MHGSIVFGCLGYLAWLSWPVCLLALAAIVTGSLGYHARRQARDRLARSRGPIAGQTVRLSRRAVRGREGTEAASGRARDSSSTANWARPSAKCAIIGGARSARMRSASAGSSSCSMCFSAWRRSGRRSACAPMRRRRRAMWSCSCSCCVPLDGLLNNVPTLNAARVSLDRIEKVMARIRRAAHARRRRIERRFARAVRTLTMRGVTHSYFHERDERMFRIGPVDLTFRPGELVFIVGGNGSGKTTLAKVLTGLYEPEVGAIEVDGKPVGFAERAAYRAALHGRVQRLPSVRRAARHRRSERCIARAGRCARECAGREARAGSQGAGGGWRVLHARAFDRAAQAPGAGGRVSGRPAVLSVR